MRILRLFSLIVALAIMLSVCVFADVPLITAQPQNVYLPASQEFPVSVNFSVMASGDDLSYQWQVQENCVWRDLATGSHSSSYTAPINSSSVNGGRLFRVVVTNSDGSTTSEVVSVSVGAYLLESIPQMLASGSEVINSIFVWVGSACASIIDTPLLLIGVGFFALAASIAILSRLLSRS